jgi:TetR/AcrR family transcriptional regulator, regulator of autoinduction and epiphytic fitness
MRADTIKTSSSDETGDQPFGLVMEDHEDDPDYDGRLLRGERTRRHIAQAMIELIEEGNPRPTARLIAERAGVSLRLVFHHFDDVDEVFQEGAVIQAQRHWKKVVPIPATGAVAQRADAVSRQRRQLYVAITPVRRAFIARSADGGTTGQILEIARRLLREQLAQTFEPELAAAGSDSELLLDAIESVTSWEVWDTLRLGRRTAASAQRVMQFSLTALLT